MNYCISRQITMQVLHNLFFFFLDNYLHFFYSNRQSDNENGFAVSNAIVTEVTFYYVQMLESEKLRKISGLCDVTKKRKTKRISRSLSFNNESSFIFFFFLSSGHNISGKYQTFLNFHFVLTNRILLISIFKRSRIGTRKVEKERLFPWEAVDHISNEISTRWIWSKQ